MASSKNNKQSVSEPTGTTEMEGFLTKEGAVVKNWKKRWCVLNTDRNLYYYTKKGGELKGVLPLNTVGVIKPFIKKKKKHCFEVETPHRNWHFVAESEEAMQKWIDALSKGRDATVTSSTGFNGQQEQQSSTDADAFSATNDEGEGGGRVKLNDFQPLTVIGRGSFGKVLQVRLRATGQIFAMKVLSKKNILESKALEHTKAEKSIMMKLSSPFIVKLHYCFQSADKLYFIMDYINGGEMFYHLQREKRFNEERTRFYAAEILLGLEYLHQQGIIYRDLKPENLLITAEGHVCMTDFGISKEGVYQSDRTNTLCGTPDYLAPEVLTRQGYGIEIDWWSFGTLIYEMLTGYPPFYSKDPQEMCQKIMTEKFTPSKDLGEVVVDLLEQLLQRNPAKRLCDPALLKAHPYFAGIDWPKLAAKEVTPPYIPPVKDEASVEMIDPLFTRERLVASPSGLDPALESQAHITDFTYVASALPTGGDQTQQ